MAIRAAQTKSRVPPNALRIRFDRFELDEANATLLREGEPVTLPPTPFAVLCELARQPAALLTKEVLLDNVWGYNYFGDTRTLDVHIRRLRQKLDECADHIETVVGVGYRFSGQKN